MKTLLWLDDARDPNEDGWAETFSPIPQPYMVVWVKSYKEFIRWIQANGLPDGVCFDYELGTLRTGYDCAEWMTGYCLNTLQQLPKYASQSADPQGRENILKLLDNRKLNL